MSYNLGISNFEPQICPGTSILVFGNVFSGKDILYKQFIREGLRKDEICILISTNTTLNKIMEDFKESKLENFGIISCFTTRFEGDTKTPFPHNIRFVNNPSNLKIIIAQLDELLKLLKVDNTVNIRIVLDSVSTLLMYSKLRNLFKFLHKLTITVKSTNALLLMFLEKDVHEEIEVKSIQQLTEGVIIMSGGKIQMKGFINELMDYEIQKGKIIITNRDNKIFENK